MTSSAKLLTSHKLPLLYIKRKLFPRAIRICDLFDCISPAMRDISVDSEIFYVFEVPNHVLSKNNSRWPILENESPAFKISESEEKFEIRQFVSFLQIFPWLIHKELEAENSKTDMEI